METQIVQWVHYDNKLKEYNEKSKAIRKEKDKLSEEIFESLQIHEKEKDKLPHVMIESMNTKIQFQKSTVYESLNYKFLATSLEDYFQSKEKAEEVIDFIRNKRSHEPKVSMKRDFILA